MITFNQVTKHFGIGEPALLDVSFTVEKGDFVFITGHSGAGKTTIARLLTREYRPTSGTVFFEDEDLAKIPASRLHHHRRRIGVIYQDYKLLPELTVGENIALALQILGKKKEEINERIHDLLELVQLPGKDDLFPSQLSGGEAQRISIARALATAPQVLFADEPTGNLDAQTGSFIVAILRKIHELGTTVIMATHDQRFIDQYPSRIFHLEQGHLTVQEKGGETPKKQTTNKEKETEKDVEKETEKEKNKTSKPSLKDKIEGKATHSKSDAAPSHTGTRVIKKHPHAADSVKDAAIEEVLEKKNE